MKIETRALRETTVQSYSYMLELIDADPAYQREGDVWNEETKSRLIDSMINGLDVPKFYLEDIRRKVQGTHGPIKQFAILDGKQRTESIQEFLQGTLKLPNDFIYFQDESVDAKSYTLPRLWNDYPELARRFLDFELAIISVRSDSFDLIEEMFVRLNNSTALNAAEARNAIRSYARDSSMRLAEHDFFSEKTPIKNARYKYRELATKFLAFEYQFAGPQQTIKDSKKSTLDQLFKDSRVSDPKIPKQSMMGFEEKVRLTLDRMEKLFADNDVLLRSIGTLSVYYLYFRDSGNTATRNDLMQFESARNDASAMESTDPSYNSSRNVLLRDYNGLVQSANDGSALRERVQILSDYISGRLN